MKFQACLYSLLLLVTMQSSPVAAEERPALPAVAAGETHALYLDAEGGLWGWGEICLPEKRFVSEPVRLMDGVVSMAAGQRVSLGVKRDGSLWILGCNAQYIADMKRKDATIPFRLVDKDVVATAAFNKCFYITANGSLYGAGEGKKSATFAKLLNNVRAVSTNLSHTLILTAKGELFGLGTDLYGELGLGAPHNRSFATPQKTILKAFQGHGRLKYIRAGIHMSWLVTADGTGWYLGREGYGRVALPVKEPHPVKITDVDNISAIVSAEGAMRLVLKGDGSLWLNNWDTQYTSPEIVPRIVYGEMAKKLDSEVASIDAGMDFYLYLKQNGELWGWGRNDKGQVGDGSFEDRKVPVRVKIPLEAGRIPPGK